MMCTMYFLHQYWQTCSRKIYSHVVSQSIQWVYPSFLRYTSNTSTCESLECLYMYNIVSCDPYYKVQYILSIKVKKVINVFIDLFTEMVSYCSCQLYALLIKSYGKWDFFTKRNWQIHRQISQNLHAFENCPFHGHIQIIFNSNITKSATV